MFILRNIIIYIVVSIVSWLFMIAMVKIWAKKFNQNFGFEYTKAHLLILIFVPFMQIICLIAGIGFYLMAKTNDPEPWNNAVNTREKMKKKIRK